MMHVFDPPIVAKFVRIHPIKGQNSDGPTRRINPRVTLIYCDDGESACEGHAHPLR